MDLPKRKRVRLKNYDYNSTGAYFITICTQNKQKILSDIVSPDNITVGTGVPDGPQFDGPIVKLTEYGKIADKYINQLNNFYEYVSVDRYVIMPNHIHLLIRILPLDHDTSTVSVSSNSNRENGPSGTPVPTVQNSIVSRFVSTFKRFCNNEYGKNIWQSRSYDHVIRNRQDYDKITEYIYENPMRWQYDCFYN